MATIKKQQRFRRADSGEYTTKKYADKHPHTTVKETDKPAPRQKKKKR
jgi:hypothetical protein